MSTTIKRVIILLGCILLPLGIATAASAGGKKASGVTFGDKPVFQTDDNFEYSLSDDKKAFTIAFKTAFEATVGNVQDSKTPDVPVGSKLFSVVLPVSGKAIDSTFIVTAFVSAEDGARGALLFMVNDKTTLMQFPPGEGKEVLVKLRYRAKAVSDVRMTLVLLAQRDQAHPKASALVHVNAIDTDAALAARKTAKK